MLSRFNRLIAGVFLLFFAVLGSANAHHDEGGSALATGGNPPEAGKGFWVGYHVLTPPGTEFYTFWPNGHEAPLTNWSLPEGFETGATWWPEFKNFGAADQPVFGFDPETTLWQWVRVPETWDGSAFDITLDIAYYVCAPDCQQITEKAQFSWGGEEPPVNVGRVQNPRPFTLGRLATHANAGTDDQFSVGVNYRRENHTDKVKTVYFLSNTPGLFPEQPPLVLDASEKQFYQDAFRGYLGVSAVTEEAKAFERIKGIVLFERADGTGFEATSLDKVNDHRMVAALEIPESATGAEFTIWTAFLFALVGGLILNIMPCVLPVLALKVFSFMNTSVNSPGQLRADGLAYTAGIVLSFALVGAVLLGFRAGGEEIGWGFQMQNPVFVFSMALLIFAVGLNFLGAFEVSAGKLAGLGQKLTEKEGPSGAFFTGVLATVVATPCTAPFMAGALAYGVSQSAAVSFLVFIGLGLGLALPYLLLSFIPALGKFLPKPGTWMTTFKQFLAFPLFGTVVWLLWILNIQTGASGLLITLSALLLIALAVWASGIMKKKAVKAAFVTLLIAGAISPAVFADKTLPVVAATQGQSWEEVEIIPYDAQELERLRAENVPVFIHFWAAWCPVCILHEEFVFMTDDFGDFVAEEGIVFMLVDNTVTSPETWQLIQSYGREGQPIDVFYPPGGEAVVLPEVFNKEYLLARLAQELDGNTPVD